MGSKPVSIMALAAAGIFLAACSEDEAALHVGYVEADWQYVSAPQSGWIVERPVREGDQIAVGDLLFALDADQQTAAVNEAASRVAQAEAQARNTETGARAPEVSRLRAQLHEAEAALEQAISDRGRILPLVERGLEPASRGDQVEAAVERAEAMVDAAREAIRTAELPARDAEQEASLAAVDAAAAARATAEIRLSERQITSRLAGRIEQVFYAPGEFVNMGAPVLAVLPPDGLTVHFFVSQEELPQLSIGQNITILSDGAGAEQARISYIASEAEFTPPVIYSKDSRGKLVFLVEADLPAGTVLRAGLPVDVDFSR